MAAVPVAIPADRALLAAWAAGFAQGPSVFDDCQVPRLALGRRRPALERRSDGFVISRSDQVPSSGDASDVGVDGERRMASRHREHDVGGLWAYAGQLLQRGPRSLGGERQDRLDVSVPLLEDGRGDASDPRRLLTREAGVPDRSGDFVDVGGRKSLRGDFSKGASQSFESSTLVDGRRALRQHGRDERLERRHPSRPVQHGVSLLEDLHRAPEGARVHGRTTPRVEKRLQPLTNERAIVTMFRGRSRKRRVKYGSQSGP